MTNKQQIERKAFIFNKQKYNMYDGPGVRTMVFFKGCPLRCKWCANPEGLEKKHQIMFKEKNCVDCGACVPACPVGIHKFENGKHIVDRSISCIGCNRCVEACMYSALSLVGEQATISELLAYIEEDRAFYEQSGGGVTLGGGEVLAQPEAAANLLMACKQAGIHTAIETSGYTSKENLLKVAEFVDLFLFDIKNISSDKHFELTGVRNEIIIENLLELLERRKNVQIRMPLLKGTNDSEDEIKGVIELLMPYKDKKHFQGIHILPYHKLGVNKYHQLNMCYPVAGDPSLSDADLAQIENWIKDYDFPVEVVKH